MVSTTPDRAKGGVFGSLDALSLQTQLPEATASNPVSAGTPSPTLDPARSQDFVPPQRPSSTPFPQLDPDVTDIQCRDCLDPATDADGGLAIYTANQELERLAGYTTTPSRSRLGILPIEIQEIILDHVFGFRISGSSESSMVGWSTALRHARRKEISELALVSRTWRELIQERLYRHIKVQAKTLHLAEYSRMFGEHPHLQQYVKHLEVWFPVFEQPRNLQAQFNAGILPPVTIIGTETTYALPQDNSSLEEVFQTVKALFPKVHVLTLEGGERRKAPKVRHWRFLKSKPFEKLDSVRTLICKGQWNLIRNLSDFQTMTAALPSLQEWQASYSKPKSKSYLTMATILPRLPKSKSEGRVPVVLPTLLTRHTVQPYLGAHLYALKLSVENDCRREASVPNYARKVWNRVHFCLKLAEGTPTLRHLSYTGRFCHELFDAMAKLHNTRTTYLKSIDLTIKNTCRPPTTPPNLAPSGSGMTDATFISAFGDLVVSAVKSLKSLTQLEYLRIRFVDLGTFLFIIPQPLDSQHPAHFLPQ